MTRRKVFDPGAAPPAFWHRDDVQVALAKRDIAELFRRYLEEFTECTQTQLALLTEHDRSDVSNWIRGTRQSRVSDIEVLTRIAEGLQMPNEARVLMGLAPANALFSSVRDERSVSGDSYGDDTARLRLDGSESSLRISICGSRSPGTNLAVIDAAIPSLARLVVVRNLRVNHGPVGVGIEVMTHIADRFRPPGLRGAVALFGRRNIVFDADYVIVVGGGQGTRDEVDLAFSMNKRVIAIPGSGGTARWVHDRLCADARLRTWIPQPAFAVIDSCSRQLSPDADRHTVERMTEETMTTIDGLIHDAQGEDRA